MSANRKRAATFHGLTPAEIEADVQAKGNDRSAWPYVVEVSVERIEAAARAMFAAEQCDREQTQSLGAQWRGRLDDTDRDEYRALARAALTATRPNRINFAAWLYREHVTASGNPQPAWESIDQDVWLRRADEGIAVLGGAA